MVQDEAYLLALLECLARHGVRVAVDTCGHAPYARFQAIVGLVDTFLYDIKAIDPKLHERYTGVSNDLILDNARRLSKDGARIHVRVPIVPGVNASGAEMARIVHFIQQNVHAEQVNLMPYHRLGQDKGARLSGWQGTLFDEPTPDDMEAIASAWREAGFENVQIGG